jgi:hypothetical protein
VKNGARMGTSEWPETKIINAELRLRHSTCIEETNCYLCALNFEESMHKLLNKKYIFIYFVLFLEKIN